MHAQQHRQLQQAHLGRHIPGLQRVWASAAGLISMPTQALDAYRQHRLLQQDQLGKTVGSCLHSPSSACICREGIQQVQNRKHHI